MCENVKALKYKCDRVKGTPLPDPLQSLCFMLLNSPTLNKTATHTQVSQSSIYRDCFILHYYKILTYEHLPHISLVQFHLQFLSNTFVTTGIKGVPWESFTMQLHPSDSISINATFSVISKYVLQ